MAEKTTGERLERVETILERVERSLERFDHSLDKFNEALDIKASKRALGDLEAEMNKVKERVWYASGVAAVLSALAAWFGKDWLGGSK